MVVTTRNSSWFSQQTLAYICPKCHFKASENILRTHKYRCATRLVGADRFLAALGHVSLMRLRLLERPAAHFANGRLAGLPSFI
jgi:hypothetical protein